MRILVVEDEVNIAGALDSGLRSQGYGVEVVHDGEEGLWRALNGQFDAILLDIMLPGLNGFVVCSRIREAGVTTPIMMLTSKDGEYDEAEGLDAGADDYLTKPFSYVVLLARVRALTRRRGSMRSEVLRSGEIVLDTLDRTCRNRGDLVALTPREFSLLEALMVSDRVLAKQELIDQVWGMDFMGNANIVEVYVRYLRKKLDRPNEPSGIETVRGVGYGMSA